MGYTWSYSSLSLYKQCPHKFYRMRVAKDVVDPPAKHLDYGLAVHKSAEDYIKDGAPLVQEHKFVQPVLDKLKTSKGDKLCEHQMGLTKGLEPCGFHDKDVGVWWRGVADLIVLKGPTALVVDYKTGKSARYADTKQLEILSLAVFKHFPEVTKIKAALLFVVSKEMVKAEYEAAKAHEYWVKWLQDTARMEGAYKTGVWNPRPNFTCAKHCAVKDCVHNGHNGYR